MKIGVRAHDYGKQEIEQLAKTLNTCGYQCCQLAMPKAIAGIDSFADIKPEHLERVRTAFENNQVEISVFGCYVDLSNPNDEIRRNAINTLKMGLAFGKAVGAKCIGTETAAQRLDEAQKKIRYPLMLDAVKEVVEEAARLNVKLALEPVYYYPLDSLRATQDVLQTINDKSHLRMIFDPCNVLQVTDVDRQEEYWTEWLDNVGSYIEAMHIKYQYFTEDGWHVGTALGKGVVQYDTISKWLHANNPHMPLLREELRLVNAEADIAYMKNL